MTHCSRALTQQDGGCSSTLFITARFLMSTDPRGLHALLAKQLAVSTVLTLTATTKQVRALRLGRGPWFTASESLNRVVSTAGALLCARPNHVAEIGLAPMHAGVNPPTQSGRLECVPGSQVFYGFRMFHVCVWGATCTLWGSVDRLVCRLTRLGVVAHRSGTGNSDDTFACSFDWREHCEIGLGYCDYGVCAEDANGDEEGFVFASCVDQLDFKTDALEAVSLASNDALDHSLSCPTGMFAMYGHNTHTVAGNLECPVDTCCTRTATGSSCSSSSYTAWGETFTNPRSTCHITGCSALNDNDNLHMLCVCLPGFVRSRSSEGCVPCSSGWQTNEDRSACRQCAAGTSCARADTVVTCAAGTRSDAGATTCTSCGPGFYCPEHGHGAPMFECGGPDVCVTKIVSILCFGCVSLAIACLTSIVVSL